VQALFAVGVAWFAVQDVENTSVGAAAREGAAPSRRAASPAEAEAEISRVWFAMGPRRVLEYF
jgi:hypothetical protein